MLNGERLIEKERRHRELGTVVLLAALFLILTAIEFKLFGMSQQLPFAHSIFFLGLVNTPNSTVHICQQKRII